MDKYKKARVLGIVLSWIVRLIKLTLRIKVVSAEGYDEKGTYVYGFWHGKIFLPLIIMASKGRKIINMVSPSKDGEIMASLAKKYGYTSIRASSDREGFRGLIEAVRKIKEGYSVGFAADGPKGPPMVVKPGIVYTAQKSGREIVPLGSAFSSKWVITKAWDKTEIPKPFSKCVYYIGTPYKVEKDSDIEEIMKFTNMKINEADSIAEAILREKK